ncbi:MAG TPA: tRNA-intron lyase [Methanocorpusculum sp.]|nr:tRNA-intron lyase [Methanocorpusculum sp.]
MKAELKDKYVIASQEALVYYDQGGYGQIDKNNHQLRLKIEEALYLMARGKLQVTGWSFDSLLTFMSETSPDFLRQYIVYRDLRERGFVVTPGPHDYRVFPRGKRPGTGESKQLVRILSERNNVDILTILHEAKTAENMRKQFILAVVDDEHELTYYEIRINNFESIHTDIDTIPYIQATLAGVPAYVIDNGNGDIKKLNEMWYGKMLDDKRLFLTPLEISYLLELNKIKLIPDIQKSEYTDLALKYDPEFNSKMVVYQYLRNKGYLPRTGYKYGHFLRVYTKNKKHSEMLVHIFTQENNVSMSLISRSVRLAHSVKKKMLFACISNTDNNTDNNILFIEFTRIKL